MAKLLDVRRTSYYSTPSGPEANCVGRLLDIWDKILHISIHRHEIRLSVLRNLQAMLIEKLRLPPLHLGSLFSQIRRPLQLSPPNLLDVNLISRIISTKDHVAAMRDAPRQGPT